MRISRIGLKHHAPGLLFVLVSLSAVVALPQVESAWNGVREVYGEQDFGFRLLREATLALIALYALLDRGFRNTVCTAEVGLFLTLLAGYSAMEIGYALSLDLPWVVPMAGLRVFEYLPVGLIGLSLGRAGEGGQVLARFTSLLRLYVAMEGLLALAQAAAAPPLFGVSLFGGGRPFGTFVSPNLFGAAMASCTLFFALDERRNIRRWSYASAFLALLSGSRTALLSALLALFFRLYGAVRPRDRWALAMPAPLLAIALLLAASSPLLSGREDADISQEGRLVLWERMLSENIHDPMDLLFGWGLGLGSNTINVVFGSDHFPGQFDSDSLYLFLLNGFGLIGVAAYLVFAWHSWRVSGFPRKGLVMTFILVAGLPFNLWEYFPQNAMLMFLWGLVLGTPLAAASRRYHTSVPHGDAALVADAAPSQGWHCVRGRIPMRSDGAMEPEVSQWQR
jgi:hypothetical protein